MPIANGVLKTCGMSDKSITWLGKRAELVSTQEPLTGQLACHLYSLIFNYSFARICIGLASPLHRTTLTHDSLGGEAMAKEQRGCYDIYYR
ncbi:MAG: hypothetical protein IKY01_01565 [Prevotella sp.]|nr:hypothetical protein [Prevotella sp.]